MKFSYLMNSSKRFLIAGFLILILSLIWEFSHSHLYIDLSGTPKNTHLVMASFADTLILLGIFTLISLKNKGFKWIENISKLDYLLVISLSIVSAIFLEIINLNLGGWKYTIEMPTIFGIGISPLAQLALIGIASLFIVKNIKR